MADDEALFRAQDLMYDAFEADGARGVELAHAALAISPDFADAYVNPHVLPYLSGEKKLPAQLPDYIGDESEAVDYAACARALWASVPGALAWLAD